MLRPRWRKVLSDLVGNKIRSLLVVASIAVGLLAVGMIMSMNTIITADMETGYRSVNPANIVIYSSPFELEMLEHIQNLEGVHLAEGARTMMLRVRNIDGEWEPIEVKAIPQIDEMQVNLLRLESGEWPPKDQQAVVERYKIANLPEAVGGKLEIELPSGKVREMELVGVINDQTIGTDNPGGFFLAPVQAYTTLETAEWLGSDNTLNRLYVTVSGDSDDLENLREVAKRVSQEMEDSGVVIYSSALRASNDHPNRVYVQAVSSVLIVLGFLVMGLSTLLITNTLSGLLNQQVHQIGVMKTLGARRGQIVGIYMLLIFVYGVVAFVIAASLSGKIAFLMLDGFASAINMVLQGERIIPMSILIQAVIALIVPQLAGIGPILHGTRISAVEALSGYDQSKPPSTHDLVDRIIHNFRSLPRPLLLSLRNTFRRKGRLFLTVFTLTLGGAIFIGTFNVQLSLTSYVSKIGQYFLADVNLSLAHNYRISEIQEVLSRVPGVGQVEGWAATAGEMVLPDGSKGESTNILAPPADSKLVEPILQKGRWLQPGDTNAITVNERFIESYPDLQVGDTIKINIAGREREMVVVGFFQMAGKSAGYLAYSTYEYLSEAIHESNKANNFRITAEQSGLSLEEQKALGQAIEAELVKHGYKVSEVTAGKSLTATTTDGLNILTGFLLMMALLIAVVGSIGLTGTMSMNVLERIREIGIIRAIGASDRAVMNLVMVEGVLIGLMSWVFGTLLSIPIGSAMSNAINLSLFGAIADFSVTPLGIIVWLGVVLVLSALASVIPARNAARLTIQEVLSYE